MESTERGPLRALGLLVQASRTSPVLRSAVADVEAYINDFDTRNEDLLQAAVVLEIERQRWQEMAEDLWEELQEWHHPDCALADPDGAQDDTCRCHLILSVKWDEITHAADYANEPEVERS